MTAEANEVPDEEGLTHEDPEADVKRTIWEHIGELRKRLMRAALGLVAGAAVCWTFREQRLLDFLHATPRFAELGPDGTYGRQSP